MAATHDTLIASAAKQALQPAGFRRKGRSRVWFADHGWWLNVVEFQPSGLSKGSYLNNAAHWLWSDSGHISFDFGGRTAGFEEHASDEQFASAIQKLAEAAADEAKILGNTVASIGTAADLLIKQEASLGEEAQGSWSAYHAGVAAGLAERAGDAEAMLRSITDERVQGLVERLLPLVANPAKLRSKVGALVERQRSALKLPKLTLPLF